MNSRNLIIRFIILTCLTTSMLAMTNGKTENVLPTSSNEPSLISDLDDDASYWGGYIDEDGQGIPMWELGNVSNPSLDGISLRCAITGGDPYSNIHCYRNLPAEPTSNFFSISLSFYYHPPSSFNNVGEPSVVQGLEFTMSKWNQGLRHEWALQWNNVNESDNTGAPKWRYWDPFASPNRWVDLGISGSITGEQWHTLILDGEILDGKAHFLRFVFDGQEHQLNIPDVDPISDPAEDKIAIAVQLDGNSTETPYEVFIDTVILTSWIFGDVPISYWANSWIESLYNAGITGGCGTSPMLYCPLAPVTRAQMAIFILRGMHGSAYIPPAATGTVFADVSADAFAAAWIEQFAKEGITSGCGNGNYCPDTNVTRAQMAIFLLKGEHGSDYIPPTATGIFPDVPVGSFAADWIEQLYAEGITGGCGGGNYCPNANVTRDQMAVFLVRAFNLR